MLKFIFDTFLIMLAILFTFCFTFVTGLFVDANNEIWIFFLYFYVFMAGVFGIKALGKYYVRNYL